MAGVISTGNHPAALWPGVQRWFGAKYSEIPMQYTQAFEIKGSEKAYEEDVERTGFGLAPEKAQGAAIEFDSETQGGTKRYTHVAYALGYIVTYEELKDNLYKAKSFNRSESLAWSMRQTREVVAANVYNRAFNSSYTGVDGKELLATDHPTLDGTQSNELSTAADLSEASLEDLMVQIMQAKNSRGLRIAIKPRRLIVPPALHFDAIRIVKSAQQNDTSNNAINAIKSSGLLPEGVMTYQYLTDADAWFVRTNAPAGMTFIDREKLGFDKDNDFDTKNAKAAAYMRFAAGWTDWRGVYGSPGA